MPPPPPSPLHFRQTLDPVEKPRKKGRRGEGTRAIGGGDNRWRQIAFLIRSFINPGTHVEGIICNITTLSRFLLALSRATEHL